MDLLMIVTIIVAITDAVAVLWFARYGYGSDDIVGLRDHSGGWNGSDLVDRKGLEYA